MSLATQCPHCQTTFKVANDQLKLKRGLVRCGVCREIFNGIDQLVGNATFHSIHEEPSHCAPPIEVNHNDDVIEPDAALDTDIETLSFIRKTRQQKRLSWLFGIGGFLLLLLLAAQLTYQSRHALAAAYPEAKPVLTRICAYLHCDIQLPKQVDAFSIEGDELNTLSKEHTYELSLVLTNRSKLTQAWPFIELTLKNDSRQTVLTRAFSPAEYVPNTTQINNGFSARREQPVSVYFELNDQIKASDFAVRIYYP